MARFSAFRILLLVGSFGPSVALADLLTVPITDRGWYKSDGFHDPTNLNYIVGKASTDLYHNWFSFSSAPGMAQITDATLVIRLTHNYTSLFGSASVQYSLWDASTPVSAIRDGTGGTGAYNDLGSGTLFGSLGFDIPVNGQYFPDVDLTIPLNAAFVNAFNSAHGDFVIGGGLTYPVEAQDAYLWGGSDSDPMSGIQLQVNTVPEPASCALLVAGAIGVWGCRRARRTPVSSLDA